MSLVFQPTLYYLFVSTCNCSLYDKTLIIYSLFDTAKVGQQRRLIGNKNTGSFAIWFWRKALWIDTLDHQKDQKKKKSPGKIKPYGGGKNYKTDFPTSGVS